MRGEKAGGHTKTRFALCKVPHSDIRNSSLLRVIALQRNGGARDETFCLWSSGDRIIYAEKDFFFFFF